MSTGQAETGLGDAPLWGHKFAVRKTTSLREEDYKPSSFTTYHKHTRGEGLHANGLSGM